MKNKKAIVTGILTLTLVLGVMAPSAQAAMALARIKDVAKVQGVRANQLVGYGLVVGLAGTGDSDKSTFTVQSVVNMLKTFGVIVGGAQLKPKNVAAVMVTAQLPAFSKPGDTIDISVSSLGDAKSLQGGTLLQTPLRAANGGVYAVGQGAISTGGYSAGGASASQQKGFPTAGNIPSGAMVEREVPMTFAAGGAINLALNQPDFTTATRIAEAVSRRFGPVAAARDPGTVSVTIPAEYNGNAVAFVAALEELSVAPDSPARIVINERTGTIVMGSRVTISEVAVAQGGLTVKVSKTREVSQPEPLSRGTTTVVERGSVDVKEQEANMIVLPATASVGDVVNALNAVGATPRDIIAILQAMKAAGALHADLQII